MVSTSVIRCGIIVVSKKDICTRVLDSPLNFVYVVKNVDRENELVYLNIVSDYLVEDNGVVCLPLSSVRPLDRVNERVFSESIHGFSLNPRIASLDETNDDDGDRASSSRFTDTFVGTVSPRTASLLLRERLPEELVARVVSFLRLPRVTHGRVRVVRASTDRGDYPLQCVLENQSHKWWISAPGSMPMGKGDEYLEFRLCGDATTPGPRRVSFWGVSIPPMPMGPLSVRNFRLSYSTTPSSGTDDDDNKNENERWRLHPQTFRLSKSVRGLQWFEILPPLEAVRVRMVCQQNMVADEWREWVELRMTGYDCVGLYNVRMR